MCLVQGHNTVPLRLNPRTFDPDGMLYRWGTIIKIPYCFLSNKCVTYVTISIQAKQQCITILKIPYYVIYEQGVTYVTMIILAIHQWIPFLKIPYCVICENMRYIRNPNYQPKYAYFLSLCAEHDELSKLS